MTEPAESIFNVIRWTVFKETGFQESSLKLASLILTNSFMVFAEATF